MDNTINRTMTQCMSPRKQSKIIPAILNEDCLTVSCKNLVAKRMERVPYPQFFLAIFKREAGKQKPSYIFAAPRSSEFPQITSLSALSHCDALHAISHQ